MTDTPQSAKGMNGLIPEQLQPWLGRAIIGLGGGAGISIAIAAIAAIRQHPEFLLTLTGDKVLIFAAAIVFLVIFDRRLKAFGDLQTRNVAAQEQLAASIAKIADKDDQRAREQDIMLNHLASQSEKIISQYSEIKADIQAIRRDQAHS